MIRKRRRLLVVTLGMACAAATVGTAFAVVTENASEPPIRNQVYPEGMSLEEIAAAASGRPGEIAPPCPDVATGMRLKRAGFAFGPCDPVPEAGAPVLIPAPGDEPPTDDDVVCPAISGKVGVHVELPCARGAKILDADFFELDGRYCVKLNYVPEKDSPSRAEILCEGDVPSVGGEPVRGPSGTE